MVTISGEIMRERETRGRSGSEEGAGADPSRHLLGVQSLVANRLYDADGNFVGKLEEVILDVRSGCVQHVVVAVGGIMGIGRRRLAVPWSALIPDADYRRCVIDVAQMRLTAVQVSDADPWLRRSGAARDVDKTIVAEQPRARNGEPSGDSGRERQVATPPWTPTSKSAWG